MKKLLFVSASLLLGVLVGHAESTNRLHFPATGFSIAPLEAPTEKSPQQVLMMFLPVSDGFAPNVNVQVQPYTGTIDDYLSLSLKQCESAGFKLSLQKTTGKSAAVFEYTGDFQGRQLHWYARAEKSGSKVYLVTATATDEQWNKVASKLKVCVDSLRPDGNEQGDRPGAGAPQTTR